jgi:hypothetical protein
VRADLWRQMQRCSVLRVLDQLCHRVGRAPTIGQAVAVAAQVTAGIGLWRMGYPRCNTEIIAELAATQILPILQTHAGSPERGGYRDIVPLLQKFGRFGGL